MILSPLHNRTLGPRSKATLSGFQVHLVAIGISWPALNQIVCALRFFYGVTLGHDAIPERFIVLSRELEP